MKLNNLPIASLVNVVTVTIGSLLGLLLNNVFHENIQHIMFQAVGLGTILIGIKMALKLPDGYLLLLMFSLIIGGIFGEVIHLDDIFMSSSESLKSLLNINESKFSEGLITAFLLFCVGSMTIVGAIEEGLNQNRELILVKSLMDGFASIALAATYGIGVLFSVLPLLLFQGSITMLANRLQRIFDPKTLDALSAVGGLLIIGIAINMLQIGKINLENLLPSIGFIVIFSKIYLHFFRKNSNQLD